MARVLALHGVATVVDRERFAFQNLSETATLRRFLSGTPPFVPLAAALAGRGAALTIDDATRAAADAARLAREHGHAVTLFVNPEPVETGTPYWFTLLYALMDRLEPARSYLFEGVAYLASTLAERRALRQAIKAKCRAIGADAARAALVRQLAEAWGALPLEVPEHFATLRKADLIALRDAGVDLQNHGWSHTDHAALSAEESAREIRAGRDWLKDELGVDAPYFAVPFGDVLPPARGNTACADWLTLDGRWPEGRIRSNVFNRVEPNLEDDTGRRRRDLTAPLRAWFARTTGLLPS